MTEELAGTELGQYELLFPLGAGGMGTVYLARDRSLEREVAIKILTQQVAADSARLRRLQREARLLASFDHPNIARIHGFEVDQGRHFLVMERVPGETLDRRLGRGTLSQLETHRLFLQFAEALDQAHERGIIHRDLKPSNLQITPDGTLKILDFGLAKDSTDAIDEEALSAAPTRGDSTSEPRQLLGTVPYMSPEQARGQPLDKRTDIWSFGCCLFEALTGHRAFGAETPSDTLANILRGEPDWTLLPPTTPPRLTELLQRCLEKDRRQRQRDIGDVRHELEAIRRDVETFPRRRVKPSLRLLLISSGVAALLFLLFYLSTRAGKVADTVLREPPPQAPANVPARRIATDDDVIAIRVEVNDLLETLEAADDLEDLKVDDKALVFVVPREPNGN